MTSDFTALLEHDRVRAARQHIERTDELTLARQAELSAIPAPTGAESRRAARLAELFRAVGLGDVRVDAVGNVRARLGDGPEPSVVLSAHLDTVFGPEVDVRVERRGARLEGAGISDNARGLAALVGTAEALVRAGVRTARPILFVATVGEEGSGDLRGVRHLFDGARRGRAAAFIALDGAGIERIIHRALGSRRYRATYRGPGGHSWAAFGVANPANAVGRAAAQIADLPISTDPRTTCAVVRLSGGTGLNSIPREAWLELDLRSEDATALAALDRGIQRCLERARELESARRTNGTAPLQLEVQLLGDRPSGAVATDDAIVQAAMAATRALGREPELAAASTDANVPMALGIPAIALGAGGKAGDAHLPTEWYENTDGALGVIRALLVTLAMAGVVGPQPLALSP